MTPEVEEAATALWRAIDDRADIVERDVQELSDVVALVWQAVAEDTIKQSASPVERDAHVSEAMEKVFADFPPTGR